MTRYFPHWAKTPAPFYSLWQISLLCFTSFSLFLVSDSFIHLTAHIEEKMNSPWAKARVSGLLDMIWHNYRRCSLMYRLTATRQRCYYLENTHPPKNYPPTKTLPTPDTLFLSPGLVPPFNLCHYFRPHYRLASSG